MNVLAHGGGVPHSWGEVWPAWNGDVMLWAAVAAVAAVAALAALWSRGASRRRPRRDLLFPLGLAVVAVAVLSPLDALSGALASAHMVQHVLLVTVAAPLLVAGAPVPRLLRALPNAVRPLARRARRSSMARAGRWLLGVPAVLGVVHAAALWAWHAPGPYDAAVERPLLHALEHGLFLTTAAAVWAAVFAVSRRGGAAGGVLVLFALSVQGALLGALLTFARSPLYDSYVTTTGSWGVTPLEDQQLAGVIMWVPGGAVYLVAALLLVARLVTEDVAESRGAGTRALAAVPTARHRPISSPSAGGSTGSPQEERPATSPIS